MNKTELIHKLKQLEGLTTEERSALIELVNTKKKYGLVWEDKPEDVEEQLRQNLPVLREVKEKYIEAQPMPVSEDLFINEDSLENKSPNIAPNHILIEGDNLHALTALSFTHRGKIDVIYIDPPYNTGNKDFKYNDSFVDKEDSYRHSKWLSFMNKRLRIAKELLSDKGVIFMSIDDNENAQLKLLCDEVFPNNFVAQLIWKKKQGGGNDSTNFVVEHEYILAYAKNIENLKLGLDSEHILNDELYPFRDANDVEYGLVTLDKSSIRFSESLVFEIVDKEGNTYLPRIVKGKQSCWRWSKKKVQDEFEDLVFKNGKVYTKYYRPKGVVPKSILYDTRFGRTESGKDAIKDVLGNIAFSYPKPVELIQHLIRISTIQNDVILDFFAGSGTLLQATMALNAEDGCNRQCILVTNNENNICEEVTYERNKRVIQGYTNAKGLEVGGLTNNHLRYYKSEFVPSTKNEANRRLLTNASTELLCIRENCFTDITKQAGFKSSECKVFQNDLGKYMVVIYHSRNFPSVCEQVNQWVSENFNLPLEEKVRLYCFSPEKDSLAEDFADIEDYIEAVPLPDAIYNAFRATFKTLKLDRKHIELNPNEAEAPTSLFDDQTDEA